MATSTSRAPRTRTAPKSGPVALDLDTLENEGAPEPYRIRLGGKVVTLRSTDDIDWQEMSMIQRAGGSPELFFEAVVAEEDQEHFLAQKIPGWKLKVLMANYRDHYGLDEDAAGN